MPELAEVKLMSDFINSTNKNKSPFKGIRVNPNSKVKTELLFLKKSEYTMEAETRGKELRVTFRDLDQKVLSPNGNESLYFAMGMSGNWGFQHPDGVMEETVRTLSSNKHVKLIFPTKIGALVMYDVRNFAKWKWANKWSDKRGPDPLEEFNKFKDFIYQEEQNTRKKKLANKPLSEILMDQYYFNGIGNYLRAEILYRLDVNPFQSFSDLSESKKEELLQLCHDIPAWAYAEGGGDFYTFKNPNTTPREEGVGKLIQCYGRRDRNDILEVIDNSKRRFWFHEKWKNKIPETLNVE